MSHQEKQEIFNSFIKAQDLPLKVDDFEHLLIIFRYSGIDVKTFKDLIFSACDLVQAEQQKRIAEKARIQQESCGDSMTCGCMGRCDYPVSYINKKSIINPENKIQ